MTGNTASVQGEVKVHHFDRISGLHVGPVVVGDATELRLGKDSIPIAHL